MPRHPKSGELALIEQIRWRASASKPAHLKLGIGDDCAIIAPPRNHDLLVTTDLSLETRHFRRDWHTPQSIGHRTLARGLSDLAAMGAKPLAAFLSLALPNDPKNNPRFLDQFLTGLLDLARQHNAPLAGGDTSQSPSNQILADIMLLGAAPSGKALRRSTARPGDFLYVTGFLGGAAAELAALAANPRKFRNAKPTGNHPHLYPQPRLAVGQTLRRSKLATACMDLSDGLSTDLAHLCQASNVRAEIDIAALPAHPLTTALSDLEQIKAILHGGEDYELLFTAHPNTKIPKSIANTPITKIGRILPPNSAHPLMTIFDGETSFELTPQGWEHLQ